MLITSIRNKRGEITTDTTDSKRLIWRYDKNFSAQKFDVTYTVNSLKDTNYQN